MHVHLKSNLSVSFALYSYSTVNECLLLITVLIFLTKAIARTITKLGTAVVTVAGLLPSDLDVAASPSISNNEED